MLNTVRRIFNILKDLSAMSEDIQELRLDVDSLEDTKAEDCELWDKVEECDLENLELRVEALENA